MTDPIAISIASGDDLTAPMDARFGRAPAFLIVSGDEVHAVANPSVSAGHGAGPATAAFLSREGVRAVLSGRFGPKASSALEALGVAMVVVPSGLTAGEAVRRHRAGEL